MADSVTKKAGKGLLRWCLIIAVVLILVAFGNWVIDHENKDADFITQAVNWLTNVVSKIAHWIARLLVAIAHALGKAIDKIGK